ncbi:photosynthetic NDH subunit of subcomplex B 1, chloroplastic [Rhododendron vialii]|uniref:photosynthetic NDH subunit of subcomplex B 1, chloroplastic n=1 Tax=Rhododendron vialii TaxID=182163 RepID=UPI00265F35C1|nr:photosynthetic NDH subunit of subcomplex B 1, chloroplastic [Rhododendron vialii]
MPTSTAAQIQLLHSQQTRKRIYPNTTTMAASSLLPKSISPFPRTPTPKSPLTHFPAASFSTPQPPHLHPLSTLKTTTLIPNAKKNHWLDPFDDGGDPDNIEYGSMFEDSNQEPYMFADGKQEEDPSLPDNPDNPYGFLKFPKGFSVEVASLGSKLRGDVRRCCCMISGGVYDNLLFFPVIQLIKDRYPGVQVDVVTTARGKQCYELNKNVRWADVYDPDLDFPEPAEYTDMIGLLKNRYYDMILSTKLAGLGHAAFLFMSTARERVSYVYPNVNAAGAGLFLSETFTADTMNLSEGGYHMYRQMIDWLGRPFRNVPRQPVPPLKVSISRKVKEAVEAKYKNAGAQKGKYIVIHGIESDSKASMQSRGDPDSLLPIRVWAEIAEAISGVRPVFVIPHEKVREDVEEEVGYDTSIVFITTPGQLAALINDSIGVIATNTAAVQFAHARGKPSIGLFSSAEKGKVFMPNAEERKCTIVSSTTGKLIDIDVEAVKTAVQIFQMPLAFV